MKNKKILVTGGATLLEDIFTSRDIDFVMHFAARDPSAYWAD